MFTYFDNETHTYYADGEVVPNVSEIIRPLSEYGDIPDHVLQNAAVRGHCLHDDVEYYIKGDVIDSKYPEWFTGFEDAAPSLDFKPILQEKFFIGVYCGLRFGMTCDYYGSYGKDLGLVDKALIDWKTCSSLKKSHAVQLEAYKIGLESQGYEVNSLAIGHLRKNNTFRIVTKGTSRQAVFGKYPISDKEMFIHLLQKWYLEHEGVL